ncbi:MAG: hypothetical protein ACRCXC_04415 [Legionella sp.]
MGKRQQGEAKAFKLAKEMRERLIAQLNRCNSAEELSNIIQKQKAFDIPQG